MHARLKNEFTEDEKCHNLMRWLKYFQRRIQDPLFDYEEETEQQREQTPEPANEELSVETVCKLQGAYDYYLSSKDAKGLDKKGATDALYYMGHNPTPLNLKEFWESKKKAVDEVITFEEFQEFYKTMPDDPEKELMRAFKVFDKNGDGTLDKSELKIVLREFGENEADLTIQKMNYDILAEDYVTNVLECIDTNSDGTIDIKEFVKLIQEGGF